MIQVQKRKLLKVLKAVSYENVALLFQFKSLAIVFKSGARVLLEIISVKANNSISLYTCRLKAIK